MKIIKILVDKMPETVADCQFHSAWGRCKILHKLNLDVCFSNKCPLAIEKMEETVDKQKEIEEMAKAIYETGIAIDGTDIAFGLMEDSHFHRMAAKLYNAGYRNIKKLLQAESTADLDELELEFFIKHNEKVRKETAKDILERFKYDYIKMNDQYGLGLVKDIAAEYGVEVEE